MVDAIYTPAEFAEVQAYYAPYYFLAKAGIPLALTISILTLRYFIRPAWRWSEAGSSAIARALPRARSTPGLRVLVQVLDRLWSGTGWGTALLFAFFYFALHFALGLPETIYLGYFHEHRFGLSNYTPAAFAVDLAKGTAIGLVAYGCMAFGLFALARKLGAWWWPVMGVVGAVVLLGSAALDPYRARVFYDQAPLPPGPLREQITQLMAKAGVDFRDVLVEKTSRTSKKVQAYFAGKGPTRTIVLNDELLKVMKEDEILAAVAHEAGHVHESRVPGQVASTLAFIGFLFLVDRILRWVHRRGWFGAVEVADLRALPLVFFVFWLLTNLASPATAAISRQRERKADRYALELTGDPGAFRRMLIAACRANKMDPDPPRWVVLKGRSHPPIRDRLEAIAATAPP